MTAALLALVASLAVAGSAQADTYSVTGLGDSVSPPGCEETPPGFWTCTMLRSAVNAANDAPDADSIVLTVAGMVQLTAGPLGLNGDVSISGAGARETSVSGIGSSRTFAINPGADATLALMTIRDGSDPSGNGGNIAVAPSASLGLIYARVTNGTAARGAGIYNQGQLDILFSLVDDNTAQFVGGGVWNDGTASIAPQLDVINSTFAGNTAPSGGAIRSSGSAGAAVHLTHATIARNFGGGVSMDTPQSSIADGSILAFNGAPNCDTVAFSGGTGSVETGSDCGLAGSTNRQNTDPQVALNLVNAGGETDVLTIPATSAAVDLVNPCLFPADQRLEPRFTAAGGACDAGAYEQAPAGGGQPPPPPPPPPTPTPVPTATPAPTPEFQETAVVVPTKGTIRVKQPGSNKFVDLDATAGIPLGSEIDTKKGEVEITAITKPGQPPAKAKFFDGIFKLSQAGDTIDLTLTEKLAPCKKSKKAKTSASKPKTRKLWGDGKGKFRTKGTYSAATVRGTKWLTQDTCKGTLTKVTAGTVNVRDIPLKKTVLVRKGKSYLAKPPKK